MPALAATPIWEVPGPYGAERWIGEPGRYEQVLLENEPLSLDPADAELQFLRPRASTCSHPGPWPNGFKFCPHCGLSLSEPLPAKRAEAWSSPGNGATGLPLGAVLGTPHAARRAEMPMPGPSRLDFVVAGTPPRLLALDQTTMVLHSWADAPSGTFTQNRWRKLSQVPGQASLPGWTWSAAATSDGVALPLDRGPVWLSLRGRRVQVISPDPALNVRASLGGAVTVGGRTLVPVQANGGLAVAAWSAEETRWTVAPVEGAPADAVSQPFAAPAVNAVEAFWVGAAGQVFARVEGRTLRCAYRPWRDGWRPMAAVRPVLSPNGVFHQLGREGSAQSFEALIPPGSTPQRREFDRFIVSCGVASFGGLNRYHEPWEEKRIEYRDRTGSSMFMVPLLHLPGERFVVAACSPRQALLPFIETEPGQDVNVECRIMLAGTSLVPDDMLATLRARHVWELVPFVYGQTMFIYELQGNRCFHWPLEGSAPE